MTKAFLIFIAFLLPVLLRVGANELNDEILEHQSCYSYSFFLNHFNISKPQLIESLKTSIAAGTLSPTNKHKIKDADKRVRIEKMLQNLSLTFNESSQDLEYVDSTTSLLILFSNATNTLHVGGRHVEPTLTKQGFFDMLVAAFHRISIFNLNLKKVPNRFKTDADLLRGVLNNERFSETKIILTGFSLGGAEAILLKDMLFGSEGRKLKDRYVKTVVWNAGGFSLPYFFMKKNKKNFKNALDGQENKDIVVFQVEGDLISDFWKKPGFEFRIPKQNGKFGSHSYKNFLHYFQDECPAFF